MLLALQQNMLLGAAGPALDPPVITTTNLPDGTTTVAYSQSLAASGATPITWSLLSGSLPTGLSLSSGGAITGTPTVVGAYSFIVRATNTDGTDDQALSITVSAAGGGTGYPRGRRFRWWKGF